MTVTAVVPKNSYVATGGTSFPYTFKIFDATEMIVYVDSVQVTTGFTVDGIGSSSGGNVTFSVAPTNGAKILLVRSTIRSQATDWSANDPDPAESKENAFDKLTNIVQEVNEALGRIPTLPISTTVPLPLAFPSPGALLFLRWNAAGTALELATPASFNAALP